MDKGESSRPCHNIPGPAGRVQQVMRERAKAKSELNEGNDEEPAVIAESTQEYIARAVLEAEYDDSFTKVPWETVRSFGYLDNHYYSSLKTIKAEFIFNQFMRILLMVGIVNTYKPNGLGDVWLELKDEIDNLSGSITRGVLEDVSFAGKIGVGAVLVLGDIVVMKIGRISYLNIINKNVKLVIGKDGDILHPAETFESADDILGNEITRIT